MSRWILLPESGRSSDGRAPALGAGYGVGSIPTAPTIFPEPIVSLSTRARFDAQAAEASLEKKRREIELWAIDNGIDLPGVEDWHVAPRGPQP